MSTKNKTTFTVDGKEYAVYKPTARQNEDANMEYNRVFARALQNGALLRERLEQYMRDQNLWDDEREKVYFTTLTRINESEKKLSMGGIKLSEAKGVSLELRTLRATLQGLISQKNSLDQNTAQGQAENARFNYLLVSCLVYNDTGDRLYDTVDEYLNISTDEDEGKVALQAAEIFANVYFGLDKDYEKNLPESKFLTKFKFADDEGRLINKEGQFVDSEGNLVNEEGRYIDGEGNFIDVDGNPVTETGEYAFKSAPFLNDDGEPVDENGNIIKNEEPAKKKRGRPKKSQSNEEASEEKEVEASTEKE